LQTSVDKKVTITIRYKSHSRGLYKIVQEPRCASTLIKQTKLGSITSKDLNQLKQYPCSLAFPSKNKTLGAHYKHHIV